MRVEVDTTRCQGHTLCAMIAPEVFALDDTDGHAQASVDRVGEGLQAQVREAVHSCPEQAVHIVTEDGRQ
ncbi:ferredoxin [Mycobacterium sp. AMU20-3851]|uniref:ferredoxin n=1 Tax=Mycobacterium sp. AMU20-3851 TaxID=3122055 RepID=UPI0037550C10